MATNQWKPYDESTQSQMREAMRRGDKAVMLSISGVDSHKIDLILLEQTKVQNGFVRRIRMQTRQYSQQMTAFPKQFLSSDMAKKTYPIAEFPKFEDTPYTVSINMTNPIRPPMYDKIAGAFAETLFQGGTFMSRISTTDFSLTTIEQRYDDMKWDAYQLKKKHMANQLGGMDKVNEMWLWHGTAPSSVNSLLVNGFERNFGKNMQHGDGIYFAVNSNYSFYDNYSKIEKNSNGRDEKVLLLVRVLVGETCQGRLGMKTPSTKADKVTFYNSMTNDVSNPEMYILSAGSDNQSYIQFVLRFERV